MFSAFGIVFTVYDIASTKTATTPHIGFISLLIGFGWICLGIYSFKLAGRLFENQDFATSVRAHSRTFFKISSALLLAIAGIGFAGIQTFLLCRLFWILCQTIPFDFIKKMKPF